MNRDKHIAGFKSYLKSNAYGKRTINTYLKEMKLYFDWLEKENIEPENVGYSDVLAYMQQIKKKSVSQSTVSHYINTVRHYYEHLKESGIIAANPAGNLKVHGVRRRKLHHIFESHELHRIYNSYQVEGLLGKRNKVMLGMLIYQGLKTEELSRLETGHLRVREGILEVPGSRRQNGRTLKLEPCQVMDVYDYLVTVRPQILMCSGQTTERLFMGLAGSRNLSNHISGLMRGLRKKYPGLKNTRQIRASVIVKWLKQFNLRQVQYMAGHRYISSTEAYRQSEMEGLQDEINRYHPLG
ncbi:MAG: hypothetical protein AMK70_02030 [Nitrospira bacterium SG8_35_1]|nr:MAG: hypothetical protein AMK70_02030 [Nitrospira bacterium SG8_35_1]